ncbi:MAG: hypothetical protein ACFNYM_02655 [Bacteroidota bacterium]
MVNLRRAVLYLPVSIGSCLSIRSPVRNLKPLRRASSGVSCIKSGTPSRSSFSRIACSRCSFSAALRSSRSAAASSTVRLGVACSCCCRCSLRYSTNTFLSSCIAASSLYSATLLPVLFVSFAIFSLNAFDCSAT